MKWLCVLIVGLFLVRHAEACSRAWPPSFAGFGSTPGMKLLSEAATIDWVSIAPPPPPSCSRPTSARTRDEINELPELCRGRPEHAGPVFTAVVKERLRGASPDTFPLYDFVDLRILPVRDHIAIAIRDHAKTTEAHRALAFWDRGRIGFSLIFQRPECSAPPAIDSEMSYVVFRAANGTALAAEPVAQADDTLLQRLRIAASSPQQFAYPLSVESFFKSMRGLVLGEVIACETEIKREKTVWAAAARVKVLRGDPSKILPERTTAAHWDRDTNRLEYLLELPQYLQSRGLRECTPGMQVLIAAMDFEADAPLPPDASWLVARFPELMTMDRARGYLQDLTRPVYYEDRIRPILVTDGAVVTKDIPTGLALTGADVITVDEAFAWQAGHASQAP